MNVAITAIDCGADAIYIGASNFGARATAANTESEIGRLCDYAHRFNVKVLATTNTILYDHELADAQRLITSLYRVGVDALIVQDMAVLRLDIPPIALHASTQCDIRTPEKAKFLEALGFSRLVLARELSLDEIKAIHEAVTIPLEGFVHGALCVSYSGRCQASQAFRDRSANRGRCAQLCRLPYTLVDGDNNIIMRDKHLLSLRDFNATSMLEPIIDAGISSFKIEGRLKDNNYVKNVVAHYRRCLDTIISRRDDLEQASCGQSVIPFTPDPVKSFNRSFTTYFLHGHPTARMDEMASIHTPKSMGEPVGKVVKARNRDIILDTRLALANGDGLSYQTADGSFAGFRANRISRNIVHTLDKVNITPGTLVYRTYNKAFTDELESADVKRTIAVDCALELTGNTLSLTMSDERGCAVTHAIEATNISQALTPQAAKQTELLSKLGKTVYVMRQASVLDNRFVPASLLTKLRRETVEMLDHALAMTRMVEARRPEDKSAPCFATTLTAADNVANRLARELYLDHGVTSIEPAMEVTDKAVETGTTLMHTRYCIRRQLGACRRVKGARSLPATLFLKSGDVTFKVECDCEKCEMRLLKA